MVLATRSFVPVGGARTRCYAAPAVRIPIVLYGLALVVRLVLIWHFPDPAYPDSFYYVDVARSLNDGQGFWIDLIWIFPEVGGGIPADPTLPIPSNAHWMPLASIVQVPFMALLGPTAWASALPFALIGALAAPTTWFMARDAGARDRVALGAGILVAVPVLSVVYMVQPDNFSLYQPLVAGGAVDGRARPQGVDRARSRWPGCWPASRRSRATTACWCWRALGLAFLWDRWRLASEGRSRWSAAAACVGLFVLVMAPWWVRQLAVFGSISPSTASGKVFFIRDIGEWNSIRPRRPSITCSAWGSDRSCSAGSAGWSRRVMIFTTLVAGFVLVPFMVVGGWARRRSLDFGPFFLYAAALLAFSAAVSAIHVPGGTFIHSAVALAPHAYVLAFEGIAIAVAWIAAPTPDMGRRDGDRGVQRRSGRLRRRCRRHRVALRPRCLGGEPRPSSSRWRAPSPRRVPRRPTA